MSARFFSWGLLSVSSSFDSEPTETNIFFHPEKIQWSASNVPREQANRRYARRGRSPSNRRHGRESVQLRWCCPHKSIEDLFPGGKRRVRKVASFRWRRSASAQACRRKSARDTCACFLQCFPRRSER